MKSRLRIFPFLLYLHLILTGFTVSIAAFISLRQYTLFIGEQIVSLCILLTAMLLNVAFGSRFFGRRSDRIKNVTRLAVMLELGIALYAFAQPVVVAGFGKVTDILAQHSTAGLFRISVYRFGLLVIFLLPMMFAGGLIPVFSKYMIRHVSHIGRKSGTVFALVSMGAVAGMAAAVYYLIPRYGFVLTIIVSAVLLMMNAGLLKLYHNRKDGSAAVYRDWSLAMKARKSGLTLLKTSFVLDAEAKLIHTLLWVFAIQGFATMSFAILWSRTLLGMLRSDVSGTLSVITFAVFSGLAFGSLLFKGMADQPRKRFYLLGLIEMLTGISAALSIVSMYVLYARGKQEILSSLLQVNGIAPETILAGLLILVPALFTGASFPVSCRLYPKRIQRIGRRIGWLGFVFLLGAVFSLFLTNFILIPLIGVYTTFFLFVIISILIGLILILRDSRLIRLFRLAILLVVMALIFLMQSLFKKQDYTVHAPELGQQDTILVAREGSTASVQLVQRTLGYSELRVNGSTLLKTDRESIRVQQLLAYLPQLFSGGTNSAYLEGFGLGVTASALEMCGFREISITETSPEIIGVSSSAFAELNNDILTDQAISISIEDSRSFLHRNTDLFDVIAFTYTYPLTVSDHYSREFYELCLGRLVEDGVMCQVLPLSWFGSPLFGSVLRTCSDVFADVSLWYAGADKLLLLASRELPPRDFCLLKEKFERLNTDQKMSRIGLPGAEALLSCLIYDVEHIRKMSDGFPEITDNHPFLAVRRYEENPDQPVQVASFSNSEGVSYPDWIDFSGNCVVSESYTINIIESYRKILLKDTEYP